ncbi:hypothetical protein [Cryobacterium serini]|uniref:PQQ-binding-like beta-propeller repeat protein n=1 Tax=Cryobacterium serini TaxID=1259201 RepID=A0A4R9BU36_9MICO|nr:hypothetical protein [Cryobacterium serini]TFD89887.1 hypothetical protein E3T51_04025 [Cryobacterium serini]
MAVIAALSGCSAPAPEAPAAADPFDLTAPIEPSWTAEVDLVGYPIYLDGYVASYVAATDGALHVVVWDAATGTEEWRNIAGLGAVSAESSITLAGLESGGKSFVTYLSPSTNPDDPEGWSDLMISEIGTATSTVGLDDEIWANSVPSVCADGKAVCFRGYSKETADGDSAWFRSAPNSGTIVADTTVAVPDGARLIGTNVFSTNDRSEGAIEQLGYSAGGVTVWQVPYADVFGEGYTSDGGWNWSIFESDDVIVGSGYFVDQDRVDGGEFVHDYTKRAVVGLNPATGDVLWRLAGAATCAGSPNEYDLVDGLVPLCRTNAGTETGAFGADGTTIDRSRADYDMDVIGVDPLSGDIGWTYPVGDAGLNETQTAALSFRSFSPTRPFDISGTVRLVDMLRGDARDVPEDAILPCNEVRDAFSAPKSGAENDSVVEYDAGNDAVPCTSDLIALDGTAYSAAAARMAGVETSKNTFVVGGATGLSSYTLPD